MKINWSRFKLPKIKSKTAELEEKIKDLEERIFEPKKIDYSRSMMSQMLDYSMWGGHFSEIRVYCCAICHKTYKEKKVLKPEKTPIEWEKKSRGKNPSGGGGVKLYKYPFPLDLWQKYFDKRYFGDEGLYSWRSEDVKKDVKDFISSLLKQQIEEVREKFISKQELKKEIEKWKKEYIGTKKFGDDSKPCTCVYGNNGKRIGICDRCMWIGVDNHNDGKRFAVDAISKIIKKSV